jgi:hypothetical protein
MAARRAARECVTLLQFMKRDVWLLVHGFP